MDERKFEIATSAGVMNSFACYPDEGGPYPPVIFFHDAPGVRVELFEMARRFASSGYYVIMPNLFYRTARDVVIDGNWADIRGSYDNELMIRMILSVSNQMAIDDTASVLEEIARDPKAKDGHVGAVGYCMGGRFAVCAANEYPQIVVAAAYCATAMVTDQTDSPHKNVAGIKGHVYFGCAEVDEFLPPEQIECMRISLESAGVDHRIEIYPDTIHAFAFRDRNAHVQVAEDRHWARSLGLFDAYLR